MLAGGGIGAAGGAGRAREARRGSGLELAGGVRDQDVALGVVRMVADLGESEDGGEERLKLVFEGVEAYKSTYLTSCSAEMFNIAYGKLVTLGATPWLGEVLKSRAEAIQSSTELQHLMICFDDGPCYEVICVRFNETTGDR